MLGRKAKKIRELTTSVEFWQGQYSSLLKKKRESEDEHTKRVVELLHANTKASTERDDYAEKIADSYATNTALSQENSELSIRLSIFQDLFKQLRINVKFPSKRK